MTKLNMNSEWFATRGVRKPNVRKSLFKNNYERGKGPYLQLHRRYDSTWVVTTDFCSIKVEGEANETLRDTILIYDRFHQASYRWDSNEIKYPLIFVQDCCDLIMELWSDEPTFHESKFCRSLCAASTKKDFDMVLCNYICIL